MKDITFRHAGDGNIEWEDTDDLSLSGALAGAVMFVALSVADEIDYETLRRLDATVQRVVGAAAERHVAQLLSAYLGHTVYPDDVAEMARLAGNGQRNTL